MRPRNAAKKDASGSGFAYPPDGGFLREVRERAPTSTYASPRRAAAAPEREASMQSTGPIPQPDPPGGIRRASDAGPSMNPGSCRASTGLPMYSNKPSKNAWRKACARSKSRPPT